MWKVVNSKIQGSFQSVGEVFEDNLELVAYFIRTKCSVVEVLNSCKSKTIEDGKKIVQYGIR